ncbi:cellulose biosynthesis protein BcsQ [Pseudomonas syringae]|uniref:cellulose biosynthesis protein BcsQ n=1 Tax=Pseudomonas syringae TaxID=317 RepID=UPI0002A7B001|nr:cellulose biosynthesis protein BcsQ [Pseudomonas syringae]ELQ10806.1 cell morphology protein [Pseudomonas syringae BRIP39023]MCK9775751.1 cellulose synthase operon protein YhjQ [Pseudomonas syringae pv. syringae]RXF65359.1 cellulose synthase operon protein YhjQ [Pseudomonas syringae]
MNRADDVANLFQRFGASSEGYLEIDDSLDYHETPVDSVFPATPPRVTDQSVPEQTCAAQSAETPDTAPDLQMTPTAKGAASGVLANLLAEAAQARQAEAQARNNEALVQSLFKGQPPRTSARVIAVVSAKGGVGKSTLSAAMASLVRVPGAQTLAIDLDPQNALMHHLNASPDVAGLGGASLSGENWRTLLLTGSCDTQVLPYGALPLDERRSLEHFQENDPHWLVRQIARMQLDARDVVILDVPCGDLRMLQQALTAASQVLVVLTADAACYVTLDQMQGWLEPVLAGSQPPACHYVINRFDVSRTFSRDMYDVLARRLGERLLGVVRDDYALAEALAYGHNAVQVPSASPGTQDLRVLSNVLIARLLTQDVEENRLS